MAHSRAFLRVLLAGAALGALGTAGPVLAQDEGGQSGVERIVVTAQFREQSLQDTPVAITAVNAALLEARSQTNIVDVANQAPNVRLTKGSAPYGPSLQAHIRGVGQHDFSFALEPGVGVYVDDVYYATLTGSILDLLDLDRVEILRGPQGTLAGQNSIGGAIKLFSRAPTGDGGGFVQGTFGEFNRTEVRAAADFTLVPDRLFGRISGVSAAKDGYVTRYDYACTHPGTAVPSFKTGPGCELGTEGGISYSGLRGSLRWTPGDRVEVNLIGDYTNDNSEASPFTLLYVGNLAGPGVTGANPANHSINGVPLGAPTGSAFISYSPFGPYALDTFSDSPYINYSTHANPAPVDGTAPYANSPIYQVDSWGVSATADVELTDNLNLKSISAYRRYEGEWSIDEDGSPIGSTTLLNQVWHWQLTQEFRLNGTLFDDAVNYTLGAFYLDKNSWYGGRVDLNTLQFVEDDTIPATTQALFANVDWAVTDRLSLIAGVRYSDVEKTFNYGRKGIPGNIYGGLAPPAVRPLDGVAGAFSGDRWDYRAVAQYRWSDALMTYAQYSTGFKSGGVNPRPFFPNQALPHNPEELTAYEIGAKSDLLDGALRLNAAVFQNKYDDILMTVNSCPPPATPTPCAMPVNAGEADVQGFELEAFARPIDGLTIDASYSYLDFEYTSLTAAALGSGITLDMRMPFAPESQYSIGAQYEIQLGQAGTLTPRLDYAWQDSYFTGAINRAPYNVIESRGLLNGRLTWRPENDEWAVALEVTNMADELYYTGIFDNRGSSRTIQGQPGLPQEWAITVRRNF
jgi:iron complex outermembrane receptor protein